MSQPILRRTCLAVAAVLLGCAALAAPPAFAVPAPYVFIDAGHGGQFSNANEHGLSGSGFRLQASLDDHMVRVVVEDSGMWLPPRARPDRGRGLQLMRALMSSVEVEPGPRGTRVTLEKRLLGEEQDAPVTTGR